MLWFHIFHLRIFFIKPTQFHQSIFLWNLESIWCKGSDWSNFPTVTFIGALGRHHREVKLSVLFKSMLIRQPIKTQAKSIHLKTRLSDQISGAWNLHDKNIIWTLKKTFNFGPYDKGVRIQFLHDFRTLVIFLIFHLVILIECFIQCSWCKNISYNCNCSLCHWCNSSLARLQMLHTYWWKRQTLPFTCYR